jgi:hypothetical protein
MSVRSEVTHLPFFLYWHWQLHIRLGSFIGSADACGVENVSTGAAREIVIRKSQPMGITVPLRGLAIAVFYHSTVSL